MKNDAIKKCIDILTESKKRIDNLLMWSDDLMNWQYENYEKDSDELKILINLLEKKIK
jgi:hypothetical protein